ncbi:UNVERIFIED_CONTAM: hypothetical protein K2H54_065755 [Gekko kuhli]
MELSTYQIPTKSKEQRAKSRAFYTRECLCLCLCVRTRNARETKTAALLCILPALPPVGRHRPGSATRSSSASPCPSVPCSFSNSCAFPSPAGLAKPTETEREREREEATSPEGQRESGYYLREHLSMWVCQSWFFPRGAHPSGRAQVQGILGQRMGWIEQHEEAMKQKSKPKATTDRTEGQSNVSGLGLSHTKQVRARESLRSRQNQSPFLATNEASWAEPLGARLPGLVTKGGGWVRGAR